MKSDKCFRLEESLNALKYFPYMNDCKKPAFEKVSMRISVQIVKFSPLVVLSGPLIVMLIQLADVYF